MFLVIADIKVIGVLFSREANLAKKAKVKKLREKKINAHLKLLAEIKNELLQTQSNKDGSVGGRGDIGRILSIKDSVVLIEGLANVKSNELLEFDVKESNVSEAPLMGVALNLEYSIVKALTFGNEKILKAGVLVRRTFRVVSVLVNPFILGRVIDPLGKPLDGLGKIPTTYKGKNDEVIHSVRRNVEIKAPGVIARKRVTESLETGIKMVDSLVPIGRGQRELIIGDKKTGKTTIALDTILHQKNTKHPIICVYVSIGKRMAEIARIVRLLKANNSLAYTVIVASRASDPASLQYIAPYSGCTMAEYFRDAGQAALIIYDDLSRHADIYRQIALLLRRPVGREAYPGDVFYLHSRLLERASKLSDALGGGSLTALPIIETLQGDVAAYIPTNVISITDGQIYLDAAKHQEGFRPAVDPGISVSRIGSAAQCKGMKTMAGSLKLRLAQFREVEEFAKFGSDLDPVTKKTLQEGVKLVQLLKQKKNAPVDIYKQVVLLYSVLNGTLDQVPLEGIMAYEAALFEFLESSYVFKPYKYLVADVVDKVVLDFILAHFTNRFLKHA